jgi:hypothetical protein
MKNQNVVKINLRFIAIVLGIILSTIGISPAVAKKKNRYVAMERVLANDADLDMFINEKSQTIDLARTQNIRVRIKARDLYNSIDRTASFKIAVFEVDGTSRKFITSQQLSIFKGFKRSRVLSISAGDFTSPTKNLEFEVYDTAGNLVNSYKQTISAINLESQVNGSTGINIAEANCAGDSFGECQIDYLLQRVQFEAKPQRQASTRVTKTADGLYKITFPFPRNKFKFLGRKVRRKTKDDFGGTGGGSGGAGTTDFGETLNISTINIGDSLSESQFITYGPNGDLIFNDNLFLDLEGKLGIGVQPPLAWLHVRNGDPLYPSIKIGAGPLTTSPVDGALEYDGTNLYFTVGSTRNILGAGGGSNGGTIINNNTTNIFNNGDTIYNQGSVTYNDTFITINQGDVFYNGTNITYTDVTRNFYNGETNYYNHRHYYNNGDITLDNGTVIRFVNGSYLEDPVLNGDVFFTDNSRTTINGQLFIPGGTQFDVLTYINGETIWRPSSAVFNGVTSINQTFNIDNATYFIDNSTYHYTDIVVNVDNGTYNIDNSTWNIDNGYYDYRDTYIINRNGTTTYKNGDIILDNGTVIYFRNGSYLQDPVFNGFVLFTDNSFTQINGQLAIPGGTNGQVLTYINGLAQWEDSSAVFNGTNIFNQTVMIDNSTYFIDNSTYHYTDVVINIDNSTVNYTDVIFNIDNSTYNYTDIIVNVDNATYNYNDTIWNIDNSTHNYFNTTVLIDNGYYDYRDTYIYNENGNTSFKNGDMLFENMDISFVDSQITVDNSDFLFVNGSTIDDPIITGTLTYPNGAGVNLVLTSDANGVASWVAPGAFPSVGDNLGSHIADFNLQMNGLNILDINALQVNGGTNGQVLTFVNGLTAWRNSSGGGSNGDTIINKNGTIIHDNMDISFIDSVITVDNSDFLFVNGSTIDSPEITGTFTYANGAGVNLVLTSDANGVASWVAPGAFPSVGDNLGSHIADFNLQMNGLNILDINALQVNGGTNGQVLTFVNGLTAWRNSSGGGSNGDTIINKNGTIIHDNMDISFIDSVITVDNSDFLFVNGSTIDSPEITGTFTYANGAGVNLVLTSDANGVASWVAPGAFPSVGDNLGSHVADINLDMNGQDILDINSVQIPTGAVNGYVLATDALGNASWQNLTVLITNRYVNNGDDYFANGITTWSNQDLLFTNGTRLIFRNGSGLFLPGGTNGQVLTYINGEALWRDSTGGGNGGTFINGITIYDNMDISFIDSTITVDNSDFLFVNGSTIDSPEITGTFTYANGAGVNLVLTSDANGVASWVAPGAFPSVGDNLGSHVADINLDMNGQDILDINSVQIPTGAVNGYVLATDALGNASWQNLAVLITNRYVTNGDDYFANGITTWSNQDLLFTNGTRLIFRNGSGLFLPGGTNGQVLTYINGEALWRDSTGGGNGGTFINGITIYDNMDISFIDSTITVDNSDFLFVNGSTIDNPIVTGTFTYNNSPTNGYVLVTDANGVGTWQNLDILLTERIVENGDNIYRNGDMLYDNMDISFVDSTITVDNSDFLFVNGSSMVDVILNGSLTYLPGASNGFVLVSDANGVATWQAPGSIGEWTDIGTALHPGDLGGAETVIIGGTSVAAADIELQATGGAIFNKQNGTDDFVVENSTGQAFTIEGANGNVTIATAGLITERTLTLSDTTQNVTFSMLPSGAASGPMLLASSAGLTVNGASSFTVNVDGGARELYANGNTVTVGPGTGTATLNVDGTFAMVPNSTQLITAGTGITADESYVRIAGNAGAVTITANPQITTTAAVQDGQFLILKGTNDTNTVTIVAGNGVTLEGGVDFTMGDNDILQLIYDAVDGAWIEVTRSDK